MKCHSNIITLIYTILLKPLAILADKNGGNLFGRTLFECPDGFHMSLFGGAYSPMMRMYTFGCAPLAGNLLPTETCVKSKTVSTQNGDMLIECPFGYYSAGVAIEKDQGNSDSWTLLCCSNTYITIKEAECVQTSFVNNWKMAFEFSTGKQIIRRWHTIYDESKKDRRWWLQVCPTIETTPQNMAPPQMAPPQMEPPQNNAPNANMHTQMPAHRRFSRGARVRYWHTANNGRYGRLMADEVLNSGAGFYGSPSNGHTLAPRQKVRSSDSTNSIVQNDDFVYPSKTSLPPYASTKSLFNKQTVESGAKNYDNIPDNVDEYYQYYQDADENSGNSIAEKDPVIKGVQKIFQNIQDGLFLAQFALPTEKDETAEMLQQAATELSFNLDNQKMSAQKQETVPLVKYASDGRTMQVGSFVQSTGNSAVNSQSGQSAKSLPSLPPGATSFSSAIKVPVSNTGSNPGAIQGMLQYLGLCPGH